MQKRSFSPKISYSPYSFVLAKTAPWFDVVCRCLPKSSDMGVMANTKGDEMMTFCCRTPPLLLMLTTQPLACTRLWYHEKIGEEESLSSCKHTLAAAAALASVWCCYYCCYCCWVRTSLATASTHTQLVTEPPWRQQIPPKKPWQKSVARVSVDVNIERSLSVPKCRTVTEAHHECQL
jgi:hypothetical protein